MSNNKSLILVLSIGIFTFAALAGHQDSNPSLAPVEIDQRSSMYVPPLVLGPDSTVNAQWVGDVSLANFQIPTLQLTDWSRKSVDPELQPLLRHLLDGTSDETRTEAIARALTFLRARAEKRWMTLLALRPEDPEGQDFWERSANESAKSGAGSDALTKGAMSFQIVDAPLAAIRDAEADLAAMLDEFGDPSKAECGSYVKRVAVPTYDHGRDRGQPFAYVHTNLTIHVEEKTIIGFGQHALDIEMDLRAIRKPHPLGEITTAVGTGEKVNFFVVIDWVIPVGDETIIVSFLDYDFFDVDDDADDVRCDLKAGHRYWKAASESLATSMAADAGEQP